MLSQTVLSLALVAIFATSFAAPIQPQAENLLETRKLTAKSGQEFSPRDAVIDFEDNLPKRQLAQVDMQVSVFKKSFEVRC